MCVCGVCMDRWLCMLKHSHYCKHLQYLQFNGNSGFKRIAYKGCDYECFKCILYYFHINNKDYIVYNVTKSFQQIFTNICTDSMNKLIDPNINNTFDYALL